MTRLMATGDNDPILWFLLESRTVGNDLTSRYSILPGTLKTAVQTELHSHLADARELRKQLGGKGLWVKIMASKLATAFITTSIVLGMVAYLRTADQKANKTLSADMTALITNQEILFRFQTDSNKAIQAANCHAAALYAISRLFNIPGVAMAIDPKEGLIVVVPKGSVKLKDFSEGKDSLCIKLDSTPQELKRSLENQRVDQLLDRVYEKDQK